MTIYEKAKRLIPISLKRKLVSLANTDSSRRNKSLQYFLEFIPEGNILLSVPDLDGAFWIDVRSHLVRRVLVNGYYEPKVTKALVSHLKDDFIDVGANVGFYAIHLASKVNEGNKVIAFEPNVRAFDYLKSNVEHNTQQHKIVTVQSAASSEKGQIEMTVVDGLEEYSTISASRHPGVAGKTEKKLLVDTITLDEYVETHDLTPGLIKVDAEGAEMEVFKGMERIMRNFKPVLVCEVGDSTFGTNSTDVGQFFDTMKYNVFDLDGRPVNLKEMSVSEIIAKPSQ